MHRAILIGVLLVVAVSVWSCVEDLAPGSNNQPKVWFTRAPREGREIFTNAYQFQWMASDTDDDLGMGQTYVALAPAQIDTIVVFPPQLLDGPVRVYENLFDIGGLPDSVYTFSVTVRDGRGASTTLNRTFKVRFDDRPPIIDNVVCPPMKPPSPDFPFEFVINAHDEARNPSSASPEESLTFWYRYVVPAGGTSVETPDFRREYKTFSTYVAGQTYKGTYKFRAKARDRAGNVSREYVCDFTP